MTVGFELIFPVLYEQVSNMELLSIDKTVFDFYNNLRLEKIGKIDRISENKTLLYSLEVFGNYFTNEEIEGMINEDNKLIFCSYSATAYAITR